ncbi:amino acid ABC transporter permease [Nitrospirillum amazonense]|uniref:amino acid ABC transporter permease n=1 Tax=Nitrospirillum amazonense TaxID=28077 RepID=UPI002DD447A2|nr:amino acid ABC transporter permease [Nitrospirillum amazonense]MEC4589667.1 amino acid ABC transporter permease [Nitrospirillum amazonense]
MTDMTQPHAVFVRQQPTDPRPAPAAAARPWWALLIGDALSAGMTLVAGLALVWLLPHLLSWAVVNGVWAGDGADCRAGGACWAFLKAKYPQILFGIYPPADRWRPMLVCALILGLGLWTLPPRHWTRLTLGLWGGGVGLSLVLMGGGVGGLAPIPTSAWGGLPITLLLTVLSLGLGFPCAVLLALGRQASLPVPRYLCVAIIELIRGVPLLSLLFIASILVPIMLPEGVGIDKLVRALAALTLVSATYLAEVLRGGLQAIPRGQVEAAQALGLSWLQTTRLIVLPQAIGKVIPPLTNTIIVTVKNTSLVLVVGLFDLLSAGRAAMADPAWPAPFAETYLLIAVVYFTICFSISRYARWLEGRMAKGVSR